MNMHPRTTDKATVLREYFLNAYLIALLKEIGAKAGALSAVGKERVPRTPIPKGSVG
jgi:hypothetical protein